MTRCEVFPGNHVEGVAPAAVRFLHSAPRQPFWLTVGFFETHRQYRPAEAGDDWRSLQPPPPIPDVPDTRRDMAGFHASVRKLDWGVGEVLAALEATGLAANTLVISTTDHGIAFPKMKCNLYDAGMGVHLVMRGPGGFTGGKACDALISHLDLFPTLCELLNLAPPAWLQGRSFSARGSRNLPGGQRGRFCRGELSCGVRAHACRPDQALEVYPPFRRTRPSGFAQLR